MSGIYLVVWSEEDRDKGSVLRPTKGGWPHITFAYTGKTASMITLMYLAGRTLDNWASKPLLLSDAVVNSFEDRPGHMRHDVLLQVQESAEIEQSRTELIRNAVTEDAGEFTMRDPHVTVGIYETQAEADAHAAMLNAEHMPYPVKITGVTID